MHEEFDSLSPHERAAITSYVDTNYRDKNGRSPTLQELDALCNDIAKNPKLIKRAVKFFDGPSWVSMAVRLGEKKDKSI